MSIEDTIKKIRKKARISKTYKGQGAKEKARRLKQIEKGILPKSMLQEGSVQKLPVQDNKFKNQKNKNKIEKRIDR
jgi:hypothetical protein